MSVGLILGYYTQLTTLNNLLYIEIYIALNTIIMRKSELYARYDNWNQELIEIDQKEFNEHMTIEIGRAHV